MSARRTLQLWKHSQGHWNAAFQLLLQPFLVFCTLADDHFKREIAKLLETQEYMERDEVLHARRLQFRFVF